MITIEEFKKKYTNKVRLLGLDLGSKKIGVSISDENQSIAIPYKTIIKSTNNELINNECIPILAPMSTTTEFFLIFP